MTMFMRLLAWTAAALGLTSVAARAADPVNWQLGLSDPVTPVAAEQIWFHNQLLMPIITIVTVFVTVLLIYTCWRFSEKRNPVPSKTTHHALLEVAWTLIPILILVGISFPSLRLLYMSDDATDAEMTLKVTGHQWYWEYAYPDHGDFSFEAFMVPEDELVEGQKRLMDTDMPVVIPTGTKIRMLITSGDVLHNWSLSEFGVRIDAVPGRLNQAPFMVPEGNEGTYYGFCSELCGKDHAYMPIMVKAVSKAEFEEWVKMAQEEFASNDNNSAPSSVTDIRTAWLSAAE